MLGMSPQDAEATKARMTYPPNPGYSKPRPHFGDPVSSNQGLMDMHMSAAIKAANAPRDNISSIPTHSSGLDAYVDNIMARKWDTVPQGADKSPFISGWGPGDHPYFGETSISAWDHQERDARGPAALVQPEDLLKEGNTETTAFNAPEEPKQDTPVLSANDDGGDFVGRPTDKPATNVVEAVNPAVAPASEPEVAPEVHTVPAENQVVTEAEVHATQDGPESGENATRF